MSTSLLARCSAKSTRRHRTRVPSHGLLHVENTTKHSSCAIAILNCQYGACDSFHITFHSPILCYVINRLYPWAILCSLSRPPQARLAPKMQLPSKISSEKSLTRPGCVKGYHPCRSFPTILEDNPTIIPTIRGHVLKVYPILIYHLHN